MLGASSKTRRVAGFTLIELILVLAVMGLMMGMAVPVYSKLKAGADYRSSVRQVMAGLLKARQRAVETGRTAVFACDLSGRRCGVEGKLDVSLPEGVAIKATVADIELKEDVAGIRFYPDGGATGGFYELIRNSGGGVRLRVDWLFGRLSQEPLGT